MSPSPTPCNSAPMISSATPSRPFPANWWPSGALPRRPAQRPRHVHALRRERRAAVDRDRQLVGRRIPRRPVRRRRRHALGRRPRQLPRLGQSGQHRDAVAVRPLLGQQRAARRSPLLRCSCVILRAPGADSGSHYPDLPAVPFGASVPVGRLRVGAPRPPPSTEIGRGSQGDLVGINTIRHA